ncbi:unnamed protein product [Brachionus calyciflorus]|uniref:Uncharacterized protein n=1 Tax=Brachionus calyciflorus TaxID=104777 RepID=A0A814EDF4_9BILA|nr:unnamed protein product [Brachionus calyciflorus]
MSKVSSVTNFKKKKSISPISSVQKPNNKKVQLENSKSSLESDKSYYASICQNECYETELEPGKMEEIDKFLNQIKYPVSFHRKPRHIRKFSKWKSSQLKIFIIYLAAPFFHEFLPLEYFYCFSAYALSIRLLYEPCNRNEIDEADFDKRVLPQN